LQILAIGGYALTTDLKTGYLHMYHHFHYPSTGRSVQCLQCPAHLRLGLPRRGQECGSHD
jgi:hypothetical protein